MNYKGHEVRDRDCRKRPCLSLGKYEHRGATGGSGSRSTGRSTKCCLTRAYRGCPPEACQPAKVELNA